MKKLLAPIVIVLVLVFLLSACGGSSSTTTTSPTTSTPTATQTSQPTSTTPTQTTPTSTAKPTGTATATATATTPASNIVKGGTLRFVYPYSPASTPGWPNERAEFQKLWLEWVVYEPLIKLTADVTPQPWLATSWEWGPQNSFITFTLRKGVKFHDGTDFNAQAVKMEGDLVISTKESNSLTWDRWEIIDDYTVRLYLKEYQNDFWSNLSGINMTFFSPTAYNSHQPDGQKWVKEHPTGTGPFKFVSFEKDVSMKFVKNDNYWQAGKPYLDGITFLTVKEALTQQATMESGAGDILALVQGKILDDMKKKGFVINARYGGTDFILFDTMNADSIYNNLKLRQAIEYAIDKQAMAKTLGYGFLVANNQMPPPEGNPAYNPKIGSRNYDPVKAKQLLTEAGYPNGLKVKMITSGASVPPKDLSIQQYLKDVGINLELDLVDNQTFWNYMMNGWKAEMVSTGYAVGPNFPAWLKQYFPPTGVFDKSAKLPDAVVAKIAPALKEPDPAKAKALSDELVQLIYDDASYIPVFSNAMGFILSPKVHDSNSNTLKWFDWSVWEPENTWLSK